MKISIPFVKILNIQNTKNVNGKIIGISLGKDSGFANIIWTYENRTFDCANRLKAGDVIAMPWGNLVLNNYKDSYGNNRTKMVIWTKYVELVDRDLKKLNNNKKDEFNSCTKEVEDEFDKVFDEFEQKKQEFEDNNKEELVINWDEDEKPIEEEVNEEKQD